MQIVFRGSNHFWWSAAASETLHNLTHYYTRNWFDRWLKGDLTATSRLLSRNVNTYPLETLLSHAFNSGAFFDGYNCDDVRTSCQQSNQTATIGGRVTDSNGRGIANARVVLTGDYLSTPRYVLTNPLGYYRFVNVPVNFGYQIMISAKNRRFAQSSAALTVIGDTANLNFTSNQ